MYVCRIVSQLQYIKCFVGFFRSVAVNVNVFIEFEVAEHKCWISKTPCDFNEPF